MKRNKPKKVIWRKVFYGYYSVSNTGKVRREQAARGTYPGRILKPYRYNPNGPRYFHASIDGKVILQNLDRLLKNLFPTVYGR